MTTIAERAVPPDPARKLVGLSESAGMAKAAELGLRVRVVERDGKSAVGTCDYDPERVNVSIEADTITDAHTG